jgi:polysaccharide biosynthesis protein PslH
LKILIVADKYPFPARDGGTLAVTHMIDIYLRQSHEITLLALSTKKHPESENDIPVLYEGKVNVVATLKQRVDFLKYFISPFTLFFNRFYSFNFSVKLKQLISNYHFDIIQFEGLCVMQYLPTVRKTNSKVVLRLHNIDSMLWQSRAMDNKGIKKKIYQIISKEFIREEKKWINQYDYLLPISKDILNFYNNIGNVKPAIVIPFTVDETIMENKFRKNALCIIGSLDWEPNRVGLKWFLEKIWPLILVEVPTITLNIAGRNCPNDFVNYLSMQKQVLYYGEVIDAKAWMSNFTIMIVPLKSGSGMRVKIVEAMAAGLAVITTSVGADGINCETDKNILLADNEAAFANSCIALFSDEVKRNRIAKQAIDFVLENYNTFVLSEKLFKFYAND